MCNECHCVPGNEMGKLYFPLSWDSTLFSKQRRGSKLALTKWPWVNVKSISMQWHKGNAVLQLYYIRPGRLPFNCDEGRIYPYVPRIISEMGEGGWEERKRGKKHRRKKRRALFYFLNKMFCKSLSLSSLSLGGWGTSGLDRCFHFSSACIH